MENQNALNIYDYVDPIEYLKNFFDIKKQQNPQYSLRAWSSKMQFKSSATIFQILNRKQKLRPDLLMYIYKGLPLTNSERVYFETLVNYINERKVEDKAKFLSEIEDQRRFSKITNIHSEDTEIISAWYSLIIMEMTKLHDFENDSEWICRKLGGKVGADKIEKMLNTLIYKGLLREEGQKLIKTNQRLVAGDSGEVSVAIRKNHHSIIDLAKKAIDEQPIDKRYISSSSFTIKKEKVPEAVELIKEFRTNMSRLLDEAEGNSIYQLNVQFFSMTE
jgi:uncharacterized protein (TIGR02147 family)